MQYIYPKKIVIGDTEFDITYDYKSDEGASFKYPYNGKRACIKFGMLGHKSNPIAFLNLLIHELKEIIQVEQSTRLYVRGTDSYVFHYSHKEHSDLCSRLAGILTKFIK